MTFASSKVGCLRILISFSIAAAPLAAGVKLQMVRLQIREGRPLVDRVYVNGHGPYLFLLDTGANINLIDAGLARAIGMSPTFKIDLASAAGNKTLMPGSDGNEIELGPVKARGQEFLFASLDALHDLLPDIQGVLGQWFLSGFDYMLDFQGKSLEFGAQDPDGTRARFTLPNGRMALATSLGYLVLDSGAGRLVLFGVTPERRYQGLMRTISGTQTIGMIYSSLVIEGRRLWRGDAVTVPRREDPGIDGLLPVSVFKMIYVSNSAGYVVFQ